MCSRAALIIIWRRASSEAADAAKREREAKLRARAEEAETSVQQLEQQGIEVCARARKREKGSEGGRQAGKEKGGAQLLVLLYNCFLGPLPA
eukprot:COSAG01_NODE_3363_length_6195_cov_4.239665_4_plen_92_part_00